MSDWPDDQSVLTRFRRWLDEAHAEADALGEDGGVIPGEAEVSYPGLLRFVEEFTALRHELKLQTKSARGLQEQTEIIVRAMQEAIEQFRSVEANQAEAADRAAKPLVEALVELDEALQRGRKVIETARQRILEDAAGRMHQQLDDLFRGQSLLKRWLCRRWHRATRQICLEHATGIHRSIFESLLEGYGLILNRLGRAMRKHEIYRMQCVGKPADPNSMTVVEVVDDPLQPPGLVVEEVRPGYYWKGKVLRFAEVRAIQGLGIRD